MSDALKEVYQEQDMGITAEMNFLLFPILEEQSVAERSRIAVDRIFNAVDEAREACDLDEDAG